MKSATGGRLAADIEHLVKSLSLPQTVARPALVAVSGLPGTGKSYFSSRLADRLPFVVLESDFLRKLLFSPPSYSAEESAHLFKVIHQLIRRLLIRGFSTILDATNLSERGREYLYNIAEQSGATLILVEVKAPPELVHSRLSERLTKERFLSHSDADWGVYQRMVPTAEEIHRHHYSVDSSQDITPVLNKIVKEIERYS